MANWNPSPSTRFQPGHGGRPQGVGNKRRLTDALRRHLDDNPVLVGELVATLIEQAKSGNYQFFAYLWDRVDGKMTERVVQQEVDPDDPEAVDQDGQPVEP